MPRKRSKKKSMNFGEYLPWIIVGALVLVFLGAGPTGKFTVTEAPGMFLGFPESNCRDALVFFFPSVEDTPPTLDACQSNSDCSSTSSGEALCCAGPISTTFPETLITKVIVGEDAPASHTVFAGDYIQNNANTNSLIPLQLDTEVTLGNGNNFILIGGSNVNRISAAVLGENYPTDAWDSSLSHIGSQNRFMNIDWDGDGVGDGDNAIIWIPEQQQICGYAQNVCMNQNLVGQLNSWNADKEAFRAAAAFCGEDADDDGYLPEKDYIFNTMKQVSTDFDIDLLNRMVFDCDNTDSSINNGIYVTLCPASFPSCIGNVNYNCSASDTVRDLPNFNQDTPTEVPPEEPILPEGEPESPEDQISQPINII